MISTRLKRMLRVGLLAGCITVMGCTSILVYADPSTEELEKQTDGLENELNNLNKDGGNQLRNESYTGKNERGTGKRRGTI